MGESKKSMEQMTIENHINIKWIKDSLGKKANKWTEKALVFLMIGTFGWVLNQLLELIPKVQAFFK